MCLICSVQATFEGFHRLSDFAALPARIPPRELPALIDGPDFTFGQVEAALSWMFDIVDSKRATFAARLKHFHRLNFPPSLNAVKGKATRYTVWHVAELAIGLEMTRLGLAPERVIHTLLCNRYPFAIACRMAAQALMLSPAGFDPDEARDNDPLSMFVYFDPSGFRNLTLDDPDTTPDLDDADDTFFYGGRGVVAENIATWTSGYRRSLSFINVTSVLDTVADGLFGLSAGDYTAELLDARVRFFEAIASWAEHAEVGDERHEADYVVERILSQLPSYPEEPGATTDHIVIDAIIDRSGLSREIVRQSFERVVMRLSARAEAEERDQVSGYINRKGISHVDTEA